MPRLHRIQVRHSWCQSPWCITNDWTLQMLFTKIFGVLKLETNVPIGIVWSNFFAKALNRVSACQEHDDLKRCYETLRAPLAISKAKKMDFISIPQLKTTFGKCLYTVERISFSPFCRQIFSSAMEVEVWHFLWSSIFPRPSKKGTFMKVAKRVLHVTKLSCG